MSRTIAISGGKGGTGKTTSAINLAVAINYFRRKSVVVDCNITTPNVGIHFGCPVLPVTLHDVLSGEKEINEAVYSHKSGTMFVPASISYYNVKNNNLSSLGRIVSQLDVDYVILDVAAGLDTEVRDTIKVADEVIIITNPELPAVTDALKTIKLCEELGIDVRGVVLNKTNSKNEDLATHAIQDILEKEIIGIIPEDRYVKFALAEKEPVVYAYPSAAVSIQYKKLAASIIGEEYDAKLPRDAKLSNQLLNAVLRFFNVKE